MDDLIALRLGALRLARRRGRTRDAAWAASRLRLAGLTLDPSDARFARRVQLKLGRALLIARRRGNRSPSRNVSMPLLAPMKRSRRRALIVAVIAATLLLAVLVLFPFTRRSSEVGGEPQGATLQEVVAVATQPSLLRGRTQPGLEIPIAVVIAPAAAPVPLAAASEAASGSGAAGSGAGAGGSGGGTGTGIGSPSPISSPAPTPTPLDPSLLVHVRGRVIDSLTHQGIPNVCVAYGNLDCSLAARTDASGNFDIPLDGRSSWTFRFIDQGYASSTFSNLRLRPGPPINIGTVALRPAP